MRLTNYPFDRTLVAQRQRDRLDQAEGMRRTRPHEPGPTWRSTARSRFTSWLLGPSTQRRRAAATGATAFSARP